MKFRKIKLVKCHPFFFSPKYKPPNNSLFLRRYDQDFYEALKCHLWPIIFPDLPLLLLFLGVQLILAHHYISSSPCVSNLNYTFSHEFSLQAFLIIFVHPISIGAHSDLTHYVVVIDP